jgi:hypothetical protein
VPSGDIEGLTNLLLQIASVREEKQKQAYAFSQQYSRENNAHLLLQEILAMKREKT